MIQNCLQIIIGHFSLKKNSESAKIYKAITDPNPVNVIITHGTSKYKFSIDGYNK